MTDELAEQIAARVLEGLAPPAAPAPEPAPATPELKPHRVHVKGAIETVTSKVRTYDRGRAPKGAAIAGEDVTPARVVWYPQDDGGLERRELPELRIPYWEIDDVTSTYTGPDHCPDCGQGLRSDGPAMACSRLELGALSSCHPGCTVACGVKTDG